MHRWGVFPWWVDSFREGLTVPVRVLVFPPTGLGDFVVWLAFLRPLALHFENIQFVIASSPVFLPLYQAALGPATEIADANTDEAFHLALILNDENLIEGPFARLLLRSSQRVGALSGRFRKRWVNHGVLVKHFGRPRHEGLRHARLLLPFGIKPPLHLSDCIPHVSLQRHEDASEDGYVVLHPYSHGHAREWPIRQFVALADRLGEAGYRVVLTGSSKERDRLGIEWPDAKRSNMVQDLSGQLDMDSLLTMLAGATVVVAGSTGPLHVAGALGVRTLGLYPARKGMDLDRWMPIGKRACGLQAESCVDKVCSKEECACMCTISAAKVADVLENWISSGADLPETTLLPRGMRLQSAAFSPA